MKPQADQLDQLFPYPVGSLLEVVPGHSVWASSNKWDSQNYAVGTPYILINTKECPKRPVVYETKIVNAPFLFLGLRLIKLSNTLELSFLLSCGAVVMTGLGLKHNLDTLTTFRKEYQLYHK